MIDSLAQLHPATQVAIVLGGVVAMVFLFFGGCIAILVGMCVFLEKQDRDESKRVEEIRRQIYNGDIN